MATYHVRVYTTAVTRVLTSCFWRKNERRTMGAYVGQMSGYPNNINGSKHG